MIKTIISFLIFSINFKVFAHEISQYHLMCRQSKDYKGCIETYFDKDSKILNLDNISNKISRYGPLRVDLKSRAEKENSIVFLAMNPRNKPIYLAINCMKYSINVTDLKGKWKGWQKPRLNFELSLYQDTCKVKED